MPAVTNLVEAVYVQVAAAQGALLSLIPGLIGALIILLLVPAPARLRTGR